METETGTRFRNNKLPLVQELVESDKTVNGNIRTATIMKEIANTIMPGIIIMEEDTSSAHENAKLPILDMEFWVEENLILQ